ncbi:hypothetical protein FQN60_005090 [Etheostoma spectabile]|uniref:Uncharacterized protein n=1 Tax=Etheostoma spectabile TaxID=54343 RepID=A0A5J5DLG8_9PERO|nr:hypothetical protein FQN60_005090 [Etheostoma spectabile]
MVTASTYIPPLLPCFSVSPSVIQAVNHVIQGGVPNYCPPGLLPPTTTCPVSPPAPSVTSPCTRWLTEPIYYPIFSTWLSHSQLWSVTSPTR